ncbi:Uncharacterised protein r2_g3806 [Pycnogonum litorale]
MAADVCQQVCSEIKQSTLQARLQLDESTDTALESLDRLRPLRERGKDERRVLVLQYPANHNNCSRCESYRGLFFCS